MGSTVDGVYATDSKFVVSMLDERSLGMHQERITTVTEREVRCSKSWNLTKQEVTPARESRQACLATPEVSTGSIYPNSSQSYLQISNFKNKFSLGLVS